MEFSASRDSGGKPDLRSWTVPAFPTLSQRDKGAAISLFSAGRRFCNTLYPWNNAEGTPCCGILVTEGSPSATNRFEPHGGGPAGSRWQGAGVDLSKLTDEQLAAETARESSDGPAFVALVDRFRQRVWRICYRLLSNEQDANDAAQEVFVRLFLHRDKFAGRSKFATWVHGVAVRTCLTLRRGRGRRLRHERTSADPQWEARQAARESSPPGLSLDLMSMLETLDEEDRAMLILKYAEMYDYEELAAIFDLSVSACKMRISRAREKLQQRYVEQNPQTPPDGREPVHSNHG